MLSKERGDFSRETKGLTQANVIDRSMMYDARFGQAVCLQMHLLQTEGDTVPSTFSILDSTVIEIKSLDILPFLSLSHISGTTSSR